MTCLSIAHVNEITFILMNCNQLKTMFFILVLQSHALRVPGCLRRLTFAFKHPDKLTFFISFLLGALDNIVWNLKAPCNFS